MSGRDLVVVVGDAMVALVADGPLAASTSFRRSQTGDGLLAAVAAKRMGAEVAFVTRVGDDAFAPWLLRSWEEEGLHLDHVRQVSGPNGLALSGDDPGSRDVVRHREGAAASGLEASDVEEVPWELCALAFAPGSAQAMGDRPRAAVRRAFERARAAGATTVHDPLLRPDLWPPGADAAARAAFDELVPLTDLLLVGAPWASGRLLSRPGAEDAAREALRRGVPRAIVRGARAVVVADRDGVREIAGGDPASSPSAGGAAGNAAALAFDGAVLAGLAAGLSLDLAARLGTAALEIATAALASRGGGEFEALPRRAEVDRALAGAAAPGR